MISICRFRRPASEFAVIPPPPAPPLSPPPHAENHERKNRQEQKRRVFPHWCDRQPDEGKHQPDRRQPPPDPAPLDLKIALGKRTTAPGAKLRLRPIHMAAARMGTGIASGIHRTAHLPRSNVEPQGRNGAEKKNCPADSPFAEIPAVPFLQHASVAAAFAGFTLPDAVVPSCFNFPSPTARISPYPCRPPTAEPRPAPPAHLPTISYAAPPPAPIPKTADLLNGCRSP